MDDFESDFSLAASTGCGQELAINGAETRLRRRCRVLCTYSRPRALAEAVAKCHIDREIPYPRSVPVPV